MGDGFLDVSWAQPEPYVLGVDTHRIEAMLHAQPEPLSLALRITLQTWGGISLGFVVTALAMLIF